MVNLIAIILPWIELTCGLLLILGLLTKGSVFIIDSLLFIFILALGFNLYRGFDISCGWFTLSQESDNTMLVKMLLFCAAKSAVFSVRRYLESKANRGNSVCSLSVAASIG